MKKLTLMSMTCLSLLSWNALAHEVTISQEQWTTVRTTVQFLPEVPNKDQTMTVELVPAATKECLVRADEQLKEIVRNDGISGKRISVSSPCKWIEIDEGFLKLKLSPMKAIYESIIPTK